MPHQFRFNNELNTERWRGLDFKLRYMPTAYPIPNWLGNDVAVDIGANLAAFPIVYKNRFKKIYSFEAAFECFEQSFLNLKEYNVNNCFLFNLAASDKSGKIVKIKQHENHDSGSNAIIDHPDWNTGVYHNIITISLEDIFNMCNIDRINFLKVDCEGSEIELLMNKDVSKIDYIIIEVHNQREKEGDQLVEYLKQYFTIEHEHKPHESHPLFHLKNKDI